MRNNPMGRSGLRVSELALGTFTFGNETDYPEASRIVAAYLDAGGFVFDSADSYTGGLAEQYLGRLLKGRRDQAVIATKSRFPTGPGPNDRGASRRHLIRSVDASLRRLQTDWIDVYFIHSWDRHTPIEETLATLDDLVRVGKLRYLGASNFTGWQVAKALGVSALRGWEPFRALQPQYSLTSRSTERELLPLCESEQLGVFAWSPLGGGLLTGKYAGLPERPGTGPADTDLPAGTRAADSAQRGSATMRNRFTDQNQATVAVLRQLAQAYPWSAAQIAIGWVLRQPLISTTLLGARSVEQLRENLAARQCQLPDPAWQQLTQVSTPPPEYPHDLLAYADTV